MKVFEVKTHYSWKRELFEQENVTKTWNVLAEDDVEAREKANFLLIGWCKYDYDMFITHNKSEKQEEFRVPILYFCDIRMLCYLDNQ